MDIPTLSVAEAAQLADTKTVFIDVRDPGSYARGHIPGALHVNDHNLEDFLTTADKSRPHIVYCYHGHSSMGGTAFLLEQGFADVRSLDGGYTQWAQDHPDQVESGLTSEVEPGLTSEVE